MATMRRSHWSIPLLLAASCGGGTEPVTPLPPPPSPPAVPTGIVVQNGNAQVAEPGAPVPVPPRVVVRDNAGRPVRAATVTFRVTAGGGSIATGSVVTGDDGAASPGAWTLGPAEGSNRLERRRGSVR